MVKHLAVGDEFGPLASSITRDHDGVLLTVANIVRVGKRNLYDVTDQYGRIWRSGGERLAGDCYGWTASYGTCGECGRDVTEAEHERLALDVDFVEHLGHTIWRARGGHDADTR